MCLAMPFFVRLVAAMTVAVITIGCGGPSLDDAVQLPPAPTEPTAPMAPENQVADAGVSAPLPAVVEKGAVTTKDVDEPIGVAVLETNATPEEPHEGSGGVPHEMTDTAQTMPGSSSPNVLPEEGAVPSEAAPRVAISFDNDVYEATLGGPKLAMRLRARFSDGVTTPLSASFVWASSDPDVATVEDGAVACYKVGSTEIKATLGDQSDTASLRCVAETTQVQATRIAKKLRIVPLDKPLRAGDAFQAVAQIVYDDDSEEPLTNGHWTSQMPHFIAITDSGLGDAEDAGEGSIVVKALGLTDVMTIKVLPRADEVVRLEVLADLDFVELGDQLTVRGKAYFGDGSERTGVECDWFDGNGNILSIDQSGRVLGKALGTDVVRCSFGGRNAELAITVLRPLTSILSSLLGTEFQLGTGLTYSLKAVLKYKDGTSETLAAPPFGVWSVEDSSIATVKDGIVTGIKKGSTRVRFVRGYTPSKWIGVNVINWPF